MRPQRYPLDRRGEAWLYADVPALVSWRARGPALEITLVASGQRLRLAGVLAAAARRFLAGDGIDARLLALGDESPLLETLRLLAERSYAPLDAGVAIRLGGLHTLFLELTGACNERCLHCYADSGPAIDSALDLALCREIVADAAALGFQRLQLTGGDPLLCPFLVELVELIKAEGIAQCEIYTNGLALDDRALDGLRPLRPAFAFSVYSHDAAEHDRITRTPGSHRRTTSAIARALAAGLCLRASVIVVDQAPAQVEATFDFLRELGVPAASAAYARPVGRAGAFDRSRRDDAALPWYQAGAEAGPGELELPGKLCVSHEGLVFPCIFNREDALGDVRRRRLREIVDAPDVRAGACADDERGAILERCAATLQCLGCRVTAYALRSGELEPGAGQ